MLYLVTGANGSGKTLNTLKWVRDMSVKESRPVAYNGRFEMISDFGWKKIDAKDWQNEPDGTIFLFDECHNDFPVRGTSAAVPPHVAALGEHRRRGFDFFLITQHPQNLDMFIRRLIGPPGWHRHLKRSFGVDLVSVLEWASVNGTCEKPGSGKSGTVTMVPFPKDVYTWYNSASLHTGKQAIPFKVWMLGALIVLVPLLIWYGMSTMYGRGAKLSQPPAPGQPGAPGMVAVVAKPRDVVGDYLAAHTPRLAGLPHTAPAYDTVTAPTQAPYPAGCIVMRGKCSCYTTQGTVLPVGPELCTGIVKTGYFLDFNPNGGGGAGGKQDKSQDGREAAPAVSVATSGGTRAQP